MLRPTAGFTLLELMVVMAIIAIIGAVGVGAWGRLRAQAEIAGYVGDIALAIQQTTTRANAENRIYIINGSSSGVTAGALPVTSTILDCQNAATPPTPEAVTRTINKPTGASSPSFWLCISAPGMLSRLNILPTCTFNSANLPCITVSRNGWSKSVFATLSGQTVIR